MDVVRPELAGGIACIMCQKKGSDCYYHHCNHKGDVAALTDANGKLAAYYEYDPWGNTMTQAEPNRRQSLPTFHQGTPL